jgi:bacteriocin-like protein
MIGLTTVKQERKNIMQVNKEQNLSPTHVGGHELSENELQSITGGVVTDGGGTRPLNEKEKSIQRWIWYQYQHPGTPVGGHG